MFSFLHNSGYILIIFLVRKRQTQINRKITYAHIEEYRHTLAPARYIHIIQSHTENKRIISYFHSHTHTIVSIDIISIIYQYISCLLSSFRLYSSYLFFNLRSAVSPERFDLLVKSSLEMWENCTTEYSVRTCAYNKTLQNAMVILIFFSPQKFYNSNESQCTVKYI